LLDKLLKIGQNLPLLKYISDSDWEISGVLPVIRKDFTTTAQGVTPSG